MNKPEALLHYETQARAALYPELVMALVDILRSVRSFMLKDSPEMAAAIRAANALVARLPAERDKGAG